MEPLTTSLTLIEIVGGALGVAAIVGGILMKAYLGPLQEDVGDLKEATTDQESRLRIVESKTIEHDVHIGQLITTSERLLTKMDELLDRMITKL